MKKNKLLSNDEIATFCNQMALLIKAGITPQDGIEILLNDSSSAAGHALLQQILSFCKDGHKFSASLEETKVFPQYVINMIAIGEESGNLDEVLFSLAAYYEREVNISDSIRSAVTYPVIMIFVMLFIIIVMITRVLPLFNQVYIQLGTQMSGFSSSLLYAGQKLQSGSIWILFLLILILILCILTTRTKAGHQIFVKLCYSFHPLKPLFSKIACGRFAGAMSLMLGSGMDTFQSLELAKKLVANPVMEQKIVICKQELLSGNSFSEAIHHANIFSNFYSSMIAVGVKSGSVDTVLKKISVQFEEETDKKIQSFISIIEPTLVIILSVIIGLILLSVILPLLSIMSSLG